MPLSGPSHYLTLAGPARSEVEVRRSRFVCDVAPVSTEAEARAVMERVRVANREARHHCTAFVLGPDAVAVLTAGTGSVAAGEASWVPADPATRAEPPQRADGP